MGIVTRGFQGRGRQLGAGLIPPRQYHVNDLPVMSAYPTPFTPLEEWDLTVVHENGNSGRTRQPRPRGRNGQDRTFWTDGRMS